MVKRNTTYNSIVYITTECNNQLVNIANIAKFKLVVVFNTIMLYIEVEINHLFHISIAKS